MTNEHENHTMNMSDVGISIGPRIQTLGLPLDRKVFYPLNHAIPTKPVYLIYSPTISFVIVIKACVVTNSIALGFTSIIACHLNMIS